MHGSHVLSVEFTFTYSMCPSCINHIACAHQDCIRKETFILLEKNICLNNVHLTKRHISPMLVLVFMMAQACMSQKDVCWSWYSHGQSGEKVCSMYAKRT